MKYPRRPKLTHFISATILVLSTALAILLLETLCYFGSIFIDRKIADSDHNPYKWSFQNSRNRVGFLYQDQTFKLITIRDGLFGTRNRPWSALYAQDNIDGVPFGKILTDGNGWVRNEPDGPPKKIIPGESFLVVTTGGSTTAGLGVERNEETWPAQLEKWLNENTEDLKGRPIRVVNGGVPGYNATQELMAFQFDLRHMKPDVWVQFSGVNEAWKFGKMAGTSELYYHRSFLGFRGRDIPVRFDFLPATQKFFTFWLPLFFKPWVPHLEEIRDYGSAHTAQHFHDLRVMSRAVAQATGVRFFSFLQPTLAVSNKVMSPMEKSFAEKTLREKFWSDYQEWGKQFYAEALALQKADQSGDLLDMMAIFDDINDNIYYDPRHYNSRGNQLIAEAIGRKILASGALRKKSR